MGSIHYVFNSVCRETMWDYHCGLQLRPSNPRQKWSEIAEGSALKASLYTQYIQQGMSFYDTIYDHGTMVSAARWMSDLGPAEKPIRELQSVRAPLLPVQPQSVLRADWCHRPETHHQNVPTCWLVHRVYCIRAVSVHAWQNHNSLYPVITANNTTYTCSPVLLDQHLSLECLYHSLNQPAKNWESFSTYT